MLSTAVFISSTQLSKSVASFSQSATPITQTGFTVQLPSSSVGQFKSTAASIVTLSTSLTESSIESALMGTSSLTQYTSSPSLTKTMSLLKSEVLSTPLSLSTTLETQVSQYTSSSSLTETLSQSKSIATTSSTPFPLSTTSTPLQTTPTISQYTLSSSILTDSFSFTIVTLTQPSPSYTPLFLSSSSLASSTTPSSLASSTTPSGGGGGSNGALSLPAVESISIGAVTIFIVIVFVLLVTIGACLCRYVCCKCHCT